jgi:hypothetical protein
MGVVVACLMIAAPRRSDADGVEAGLSLSTRLDNGTRAGQQGPWWGLAADPELGFARSLPTSSWEALYRSSIDTYADKQQAHPATHLAKLDVASQGAGHFDSWANAFYLRSSDPLPAAPSTPFGAGETETYDGSIGFRAWRGDLRYDLDGKLYQTGGLSDGRYDHVVGSLIPFHGQTDALMVHGTWSQWALGNPNDLMVATAMLGYHRQNTEVLSTEVDAGWADSHRNDGQPAQQELAYGGSINGLGNALGLPVDLRGQFTHDVVSTGMAEMSRTRAGLWAAVRWERSLDVQDGFFSEAALRTFGTLEVRDTMGTSTFITIDGSSGRARPMSGEDPAVRFKKIGASVSRRLQPRLTARIGYSYSWRHEARGAATDESFRSRAEVALTAAL